MPVSDASSPITDTTTFPWYVIFLNTIVVLSIICARDTPPRSVAPSHPITVTTDQFITDHSMTWYGTLLLVVFTIVLVLSDV